VLPVALTIAGSDPSGGAGLQADLKTFHRFGVYGEAVVTLITVQNTVAFQRVETLAPILFWRKFCGFERHSATRGKTGALGNSTVMEAIAEAAKDFAFPLVVDPVMLRSMALDSRTLPRSKHSSHAHSC